MTHLTQSTNLANLKPDFDDEHAAAVAGWRAITSAIYLPQELDVAQAIHATLSGRTPGSRPVRFAIVGDKRRICFARLITELASADDAAHAPELVEPMAA